MSKINKPVKLLIAEDNNTNRIYINSLLTFLKIEHKIANNGQLAIDLLKTEAFDCILMDIFMPVMDGFEATEYIRAEELKNNTKRIPIIAITASTNEEDLDRCLVVGMDAWITKPINEDQLFDLINEFCT